MIQRARFFVFATTLLTLGCERGCLAKKIEEKRAPVANKGPVLTEGIDCSDGLLRCNQGVVEASRLFHVPYPCESKGREKTVCECPWDIVHHCKRACIVDDVEAIGTADAGAELCEADAPIARPPLSDEISRAVICSRTGLICEAGLVSVCDAPGRPGRPVVQCLHGCSTAIGLDGEAANLDGLASILCRKISPEHK